MLWLSAMSDSDEQGVATLKSDGTPRHVGFEIEVGGLTFEAGLGALRPVIPGRVEPISPVEARIHHQEFGEFMLELDWQFLKQQAKEQLLDKDIMRIVGEIAGVIVPLELVMPPIPLSSIDMTNDIVTALRSAGASGTDDSPLYAFGVHINIELPDLEAATLARYLKAYCVLQEYLVQAHSIDAARRLSPYVDLFEPDYIARVLDYQDCTIDDIFNDYLELNPTRNRALDLLPLLSEIDSERVQRVVQDDRVKARPAFHYRMPNCDIGNPDWSLVTEWRRWRLVEILAGNADDLASLAHEYRARLNADQFATDAKWAEYINSWLSRRQEYDT